MTPVAIYPEGYTVNNIQGACPGSNGKARLKYKRLDEPDWIQLDWQIVNPERSFATQFNLAGLKADTNYELLVEACPLDNEVVSASIEGTFKTAPAVESTSEVNFIVTTGTSYPDIDSEDGYKLYPSSLQLNPDFFVHTGDILYYDNYGKTIELARWMWDRMYSLPNNIEFHRQVASYFIKDDHDTWMDDAYPGMRTKFMGDFTFEQGIRLFLEQVPMQEKTYRTVRWGKDLQIWMVEGRDYRSQNTMEDGPEKTIWGKTQMQWFKSTVEASDATFKILITPTPIVGPDRSNKKDNHANDSFTYEGDIIRQFISQQKNMFVVCGDRHWQYISKHEETGVMEFSCGPGSDAHAGGWNNEDKLPEHIYLNVVGGFLEAEISSKTGEPKLIFRHYNPDGELLNEYTVQTS
nr:alkaline phosphatase D family protein [Sunxiuqinia sp.]